MNEEEVNQVKQLNEVFSELQLKNKLVEPLGQNYFQEVSRDVNLANHKQEELHFQRFNHKIFSLCSAIAVKGMLPEDSPFIHTILRELNYFDTSSRSRDGFNLRRLAEHWSNSNEKTEELKKPPLWSGARKDENRSWY